MAVALRRSQWLPSHDPSAGQGLQTWDGEKTQSIKCLLHKQKDLSSDHQRPYKQPGDVAMGKASAEEGRQVTHTQREQSDRDSCEGQAVSGKGAHHSVRDTGSGTSSGGSRGSRDLELQN